MAHRKRIVISFPSDDEAEEDHDKCPDNCSNCGEAGADSDPEDEDYSPSVTEPDPSSCDDDQDSGCNSHKGGGGTPHVGDNIIQIQIGELMYPIKKVFKRIKRTNASQTVMHNVSHNLLWSILIIVLVHVGLALLFLFPLYRNQIMDWLAKFM